MELHHYITMENTMMSHDLHCSIVLMKLVLLWTKYQIHSKILIFLKYVLALNMLL